MIYAIRAGSDGPIKIGRATNPVIRLNELQTAHHVTLNLLAAVKWQDEVEGMLHACLAADRLHGEWFTPTERVLFVVEKMRDFDALHELFFYLTPEWYFPWMDAEAEPNQAEYMREHLKLRDWEATQAFHFLPAQADAFDPDWRGVALDYKETPR